MRAHILLNASLFLIAGANLKQGSNPIEHQESNFLIKQSRDALIVEVVGEYASLDPVADQPDDAASGGPDDARLNLRLCRHLSLTS